MQAYQLKCSFNFVMDVDSTAEVTGSGIHFAVNDSTVLNCTVTGTNTLESPSLDYVWRSNSTNLTGEVESSLMLGPLTTEESGSYACTVIINDTLLSIPITVTSEEYNITVLGKCSLFTD